MEWTTAYINDLPDSAFADPKNRRYPHHDASGAVDRAHLANAMARCNQDATSCSPAVHAHLMAHETAMGMGKAFDLKAEPMTSGQLDRWLAGRIPRRILVAPFGGPLGKAGFDLDGEYFDETTDFYGPYPELKATRDRLVDFHHSTFLERAQTPAEAAIKGAIMGRVTLDDHFTEEDPGFAGLWGDFWANAGESRRSLIRYLEEGGHPLYGSTQPIPGGVRRGKGGHIDVWPIAFHTISTSPQNTYAIVPPLKAALASSEVSLGALQAFAAHLDSLGDSLRGPSGMGDDAAKAGRVFSKRNEADLNALLEELLGGIAAVRALISERQTRTDAEASS